MRASPVRLLGIGLGFTALLCLGLLLWLNYSPRRFGGQPPAATPCTKRHPCLAIVIDDVGRDPVALERLLSLPADLTYAVLPHAKHTRQALARLRRAGREYLLHLPMEPHDHGQITDEPVVVRRGRPIGPILRECLERVPGAAGVSNHMGSALSEVPEATAEILTTLRRHGLWFLDSWTSPRSQICRVARNLAIPCRRRDVFLDDRPDPATIRSGIREAWRRARERGWAVAIGHPMAPTIDILSGMAKAGTTTAIVRLSRIVLGTRR